MGDTPSEPAVEIAAGCLALRARMVDRALTRIYADAFRSFEITAPQLNLLVAIATVPGATARDLGQYLWLEKSSVSRNLKHLHSASYIRIEASGRSQHLYVTDGGRSLLKSILPAWRAAQASARQLIDSEGERALLDMSARLHDAS